MDGCGCERRNGRVREGNRGPYPWSPSGPTRQKETVKSEPNKHPNAHKTNMRTYTYPYAHTPHTPIHTHACLPTPKPTYFHS
jgi:hypothetical protein